MSHPAQQMEVPGAPHSAKRRLVSPANNSSPGFHPSFSGDHVAVIVHSHRLVEIVPRSADEWRAIDDERRRASRELTASGQVYPSGSPSERLRHRRSKGSRRRR